MINRSKPSETLEDQLAPSWWEGVCVLTCDESRKWVSRMPFFRMHYILVFMTSPHFHPHCHVIAMEMRFIRACSISQICGVILSSSDTWEARTYNQSPRALFASPILFPLTGETLGLAQYLRRHLIWSCCCCCGNRLRLVSGYCQGPVQLNIWETGTLPSSPSIYSCPSLQP